MTAGIILFAHGSRDPGWRKPMEAVAERMRLNDPMALVSCAFLELAEPALPAAVARLVDDGARTVSIVPMFLGIGKHVREDLPTLVESLRASHPGTVFELKRAIGEDPRMIELMASIALSRSL